MSRVPFTIDVDRFICTELDQCRGMIKSRDFSNLSACIERMQLHANVMEDALYQYRDKLRDVEDAANKFFEAMKKDEEIKVPTVLKNKLMKAVKKAKKN